MPAAITRAPLESTAPKMTLIIYRISQSDPSETQKWAIRREKMKTRTAQKTRPDKLKDERISQHKPDNLALRQSVGEGERLTNFNQEPGRGRENNEILKSGNSQNSPPTEILPGDQAAPFHSSTRTAAALS